MLCEKKGFGSKSAARRSVNQMHESVRVYFCDNCHRWHNTKSRYDRYKGDVSRRIQRAKMRKN